jgi:hypothetical protein
MGYSARRTSRQGRVMKTRTGLVLSAVVAAGLYFTLCTRHHSSSPAGTHAAKPRDAQGDPLRMPDETGAEARPDRVPLPAASSENVKADGRTRGRQWPQWKALPVGEDDLARRAVYEPYRLGLRELVRHRSLNPGDREIPTAALEAEEQELASKFASICKMAEAESPCADREMKSLADAGLSRGESQVETRHHDRDP